MADNTDIIICPACGKKMKKIYMKEQEVHLDICLDGCGGIYFDNREYQMFTKQEDDISEIIAAYKGKTFQKVNEADLRICPFCGTNMVKNYSSPARRIQVDDCYSCGSKFLDYEELEKIREEGKAKRYKQIETVFDKNHYQKLEAVGLIDDFEEISNEIASNPTPINIQTVEVLDEVPVTNLVYPLSERECNEIKTRYFIISLILGTFSAFWLKPYFIDFYPIIREYKHQITNSTIDMLFVTLIITVFVFLGHLAAKIRINHLQRNIM